MISKPMIIGFLCNWCGYAGADTAGTSRISYPPNIRIVRVMCSGRVDPVFILRAFEMGADGVMVAACHLGDCHYVSGNEQAKRRVEMTQKLLALMGLEKDRLRLEWISGAEGEKFARAISNFTEDLSKMGPNPLQTKDTVELNKVTKYRDGGRPETIWDLMVRNRFPYCQECGKCSSSCPVTRLKPEYSPRLVVEKALVGLEDEVIPDKGIWSCLTCYLCRERCPVDIGYDNFIRTVRNYAVKRGVERTCSHGGIIQTLARLMTKPDIKQNRLTWLPSEAKISKKSDVLYFVGCLPYFDEVFTRTKTTSSDIARSVVGLLNKAGVKPILLENERCCGHDLYFSGDQDNFERLAHLNLDTIKRSGASKVITSCAECYRTLKMDYAELFGKLDFEVFHTSEYFAELIDKGKLELSGRLEKKVTYQDPCRLGRHMGVFDPPRKVIRSIPGIEFLEMERNREGSLCCGVSAWVNCGEVSRQIQVDRLKEAKGTGADLLVTACPKCQIHFNCALSEKLPVQPQEVAVDVCDLSTLMAMALKPAER